MLEHEIDKFNVIDGRRIAGHFILWGVKCHPELEPIEQTFSEIRGKVIESNTGSLKGFAKRFWDATRSVGPATILRQFRKSFDTAQCYKDGTHITNLAAAIKTKSKHRSGTGSDLHDANRD